MAKKRRRTYPREFKVEAVKLVTEKGHSVAEAARSLDISETLLRSWKKEFEKDSEQAFPGNGNRTALDQQLHDLKMENKRLLAERDILKKALACFAREGM